jgi:hypothetical protein
LATVPLPPPACPFGTFFFLVSSPAATRLNTGLRAHSSEPDHESKRPVLGRFSSPSGYLLQCNRTTAVLVKLSESGEFTDLEDAEPSTCFELRPLRRGRRGSKLAGLERLPGCPRAGGLSLCSVCDGNLRHLAGPGRVAVQEAAPAGSEVRTRWSLRHTRISDREGARPRASSCRSETKCSWFRCP